MQPLVTLALVCCIASFVVAQQSTCSPTFTDSKGTVFPIQYIANKQYSIPNVNISNTLYDLTLSLCKPDVCPSNHTHPAGFVAAACHIPMSNYDPRIMGSLNQTTFLTSNTSAYSTPNFLVTFGGGDRCHRNGNPYRQTNLYVVCQPSASEDELLFLGELNYCQYTMQLNSRTVCPGYAPSSGSPGRPHKKGLSGGSVLLILFFVVLVLYLVVGSAYKSLVVGAVGVEMIPNIEFWRALPDLILDGANFVFSCGKKRPGTASYDNI
eukprot:Amastigsp_a174465_1851.p2 type:complete len:266 gc:universal Amastigsp_a174465_1851:846-49(-)